MKPSTLIRLTLAALLITAMIGPRSLEADEHCLEALEIRLECIDDDDEGAYRLEIRLTLAAGDEAWDRFMLQPVPSSDGRLAATVEPSVFLLDPSSRGEIRLQARVTGVSAGDEIELSTTLHDSQSGDCCVGEEHLLAVPGCGGGPNFRRGDSNADGQIDITDGVFTLGYLLLGGREPPCHDAADTNDDETLDLADAISTFTFLFLGGATPPAPGPFDCGEDPGGDRIGCESFDFCP
jgi:hypothetical protein